jgi:3-methyladenine DNA glycosylase Tag
VINNHKNEIPLETAGNPFRDKGAVRRTEDLRAPATSPMSDRISKDLKKLGMKFVGSTVMYAHLQATGQINDHEVSCYKHH